MPLPQKEAPMSTITEITDILKKYLKGPMLSILHGDAQRAEQGGDAEKFKFAQFADACVDNNHWPVQIHLEPEDILVARKLLLEYYEDLAERGNATAMRYTACNYANGHAGGEVHR